MEQKKQYNSTVMNCLHHKSNFYCQLVENLVIGCVIALLLISLHYTGAFQRTFQWIEDIGIDLVISGLRATPLARESTDSFAILDIDEETYQLWGSPLITPRDKLLRLIQFATESQAKILMIDIELSHLTDRSQSLDHPNNRDDKALYDFLEKYEVACNNINCPYIFLVSGSSPALPINSKQPRNQTQSFLDPVVAQSRHIYWASTLFDLESDQVLRRWHLWQAVCDSQGIGNILPSMQLLSKALSEGKSPNELLEELAHHKPDCKIQEPNKLDDSRQHHEDKLSNRILYRIPYELDTDEKLPYTSTGHQLLEAVSAKQITETNFKPVNNIFTGKIVIIGGSYENSRDIHATPLGVMPGTWILANATFSLLQHGELTPPSIVFKLLTEVILIIIISIVFSYFTSFLGMLISGAIIILGMIPISFLLFEYGVWLDFAIPLVVVQIHYMHARYQELQQRAEEE